MAKEYTTKDGKKIIGWYRRGGKAIPILEGQVKKGEGKAKGEFGNTGVVGFATKNRGDKMKKPVNISKKGYEGSVKKAREQTAERVRERNSAPKKISEIREERRLAKEKEARIAKEKPKSEKEDLLERSRKGQLTPKEMLDPETRKKMYGDTIGMLREMGNANMRHSMMQDNEKDIDKYMKASNKFEDAARQFEGKRPIISMAKENIGEAHIHADEVEKDLRDSLEGDAGSIEKGVPYRIKGLESMHRKIREKAWDKKKTPEQYSKEVTDALRFTDMVDGKNFVKSFNKMKEGLAERGYDMVEVTNTIDKEGESYRGVNTLVTSPKGYTFELQFHTPQSFDIKEANHVDYNVTRRASTPPAVSKALDEQMKQRSRSVVTPERASEIESYKRRPRNGFSEEAIRGMMRRQGVNRITAIKYLKEIYKK